MAERSPPLPKQSHSGPLTDPEAGSSPPKPAPANGSSPPAVMSPGRPAPRRIPPLPPPPPTALSRRSSKGSLGKRTPSVDSAKATDSARNSPDKTERKPHPATSNGHFNVRHSSDSSEKHTDNDDREKLLHQDGPPTGNEARYVPIERHDKQEVVVLEEIIAPRPELNCVGTTKNHVSASLLSKVPRRLPSLKLKRQRIGSERSQASESAADTPISNNINPTITITVDADSDSAISDYITPEKNYKIDPKIQYIGDETSLYGTPKEDMSPTKEPDRQASSRSFLKDQIVSFFQPSDNKLAMKLFGNKNALMKEKMRQKAAGNWVIHPCSNFR